MDRTITVRAFLVREWFPISAALLGTLGVFLILPLLEWFNREPSKMYMLREVNTVKAPDMKPPVSLQQPAARDPAREPIRAPMPMMAPVPLKMVLPVEAPMLSASADIPVLMQAPGVDVDFASANDFWDISDVDEVPTPLSQMKPMYPLRARNAGIEGYVVLEMIVDEQGLMRQVNVTEADPPGYFEQAALRSASTWRFAPAKKNGEAVAVRVIQKLMFKLDERTP